MPWQGDAIPWHPRGREKRKTRHTPSPQTTSGKRRRNRPSFKLIMVDRALTTGKPQHSPTNRYHPTEIQYQEGGCLTSPPVQPYQPTCSNNSLINPNPQPISMLKDFIHRHACWDTMQNQCLSVYRLRPHTPNRRHRIPTSHKSQHGTIVFTSIILFISTFVHKGGARESTSTQCTLGTSSRVLRMLTESGGVIRYVFLLSAGLRPFVLNVGGGGGLVFSSWEFVKSLGQ